MKQSMMRKAIVLLVLATVYSPPAGGQTTLKLMTYNIYHGEHPAEGTSNLEQVARLIRSEQPDLVALQEVDSLTGRSAGLNRGEPQNLVEELAEMTGMYGYFGKAMDYDGGGYGEGILSGKPVRIRKVMLPIPEGGEERALLIASMALDGDKRLVFAGTHLCHQHHKNRLAQAQRINGEFAGTGEAVVLAGDLNFTPGSDPYEVLGSDWIDAALSAGSSSHTFSFEEPSRRIDYLFLSQKAYERYEIEEVRVLKVGYSDHMPVVVTLRERD